MPGVKLLIAGADKTAYLDLDSFNRTAVIGQSIDRLSCTLVDHDGLLGTISAASDVVVEDAASAAIRYFGGIIASTDEGVVGLRSEIKLECQDWTVILDKAYAQPRVYRSADFASDKLIIQDVFTRAYTDPMNQANLNEIDTATYVEVGRPVESITVNRTPLPQVMNTLAGNAIYEWYVDYFKKLHFHAIDYDLSAVHLSDSPNNTTTFPYYNLRRKVDGIELANVIEIVGGWVLTEAQEEILPADGSATQYSTKWIWLALSGEYLPRVYRNDGTVGVPIWTQLTVFSGGDPNYTGGANEVEWSSLQKVLVFGSAPPNLSNAIKISGRYQQRVYWRKVVPESFAELGRWYWYKVVEPNIFSQNEARLRAEREALMRKFGVTTYTLKTQQDGFRVGTRVELTSQRYGLSASPFVVERNIMRLLGNSIAEYDLTLRRPYVD